MRRVDIAPMIVDAVVAMMDHDMGARHLVDRFIHAHGEDSLRRFVADHIDEYIGLREAATAFAIAEKLTK